MPLIRWFGIRDMNSEMGGAGVTVRIVNMKVFRKRLAPGPDVPPVGRAEETSTNAAR